MRIFNYFAVFADDINLFIASKNLDNLNTNVSNAINYHCIAHNPTFHDSALWYEIEHIDIYASYLSSLTKISKQPTLRSSCIPQLTVPRDKIEFAKLHAFH